MGLLDGRTALVTGGANGIGRAVVELFLLEGARVAVVDRETIPTLEGATAFDYDLEDIEGLRDLVDAVEGQVGPLDVLVNNAGVLPSPQAHAVDLDPGELRRLLMINLEAPILLAGRVGRGMIERGYGRIVNVTSIHSRFGFEGCLPYDSSKAGLDSATRTLAIEFGSHGILVNAVAPGFVATRLSMTDSGSVFETDWFREVYIGRGQIPLRREAQADEIAQHVAWLASERNTYVTGQVLRVDGGLSVTF